jgi:hypothetical protein
VEEEKENQEKGQFWGLKSCFFYQKFFVWKMFWRKVDRA